MRLSEGRAELVRVMPSVSILGIANNILSYAHAIAVELRTDFHHFASVGRVGQGVVVAVDLVDGFLGGAVDLELSIWMTGYCSHSVSKFMIFKPSNSSRLP